MATITHDESNEPHIVQIENEFFVGLYDVGQYAFFGNISNVAVVHNIHPAIEADVRSHYIPFTGLSNQYLLQVLIVVEELRVMKSELSSGLLEAYYPLQDFGLEEAEGECIDRTGKHPGKYVAPLGGSLAGGWVGELAYTV